MSLAQKLTYDHRTEGNLALPLPSEQRAPKRAPKPAPRRRLSAVTVLLVGAWLGLIGFLMTLVYVNGQVLKETYTLTSLNRQLTQAEQENQELRAALVKAQSVDTVTRWAESHGMQRPKSIGSLKVDPGALAAKPEPAQEAPQADAPSQAPAPKGVLASVWENLCTYAARLGLGVR